MNTKKNPRRIQELFHSTVEELAGVNCGPQRLIKDSQIPRVSVERVIFLKGEV